MVAAPKKFLLQFLKGVENVTHMRVNCLDEMNANRASAEFGSWLTQFFSITKSEHF